MSLLALLAPLSKNIRPLSIRISLKHTVRYSVSTGRIVNEKQDQSKHVYPLSTRNRVVVLDIDDTLCHRVHGEEMEKNHPEFLIINNDRAGKYIFPPHLQILFEYLLKHESRVAFFSGAGKKRNESLIPALLTYFWGTEKYEAMRAKGQFNIHSDVDCREGKRENEGEGNLVKDLKVVIRDGELLSDVILVDDDPSYVAYDQHPVVHPLDLMGLYRKERLKYADKSCENSVYYLLGLFKTAFEHEKYKELALREAFRQILPDEKYNPNHVTDSFKRNMIDTGLSEVQKRIPDARLFGSLTAAEEE